MAWPERSAYTYDQHSNYWYSVFKKINDSDVEILEKRYPIMLKQFSIRENSGGKGKFRGGDGVIREFL